MDCPFLLLFFWPFTFDSLLLLVAVVFKVYFGARFLPLAFTSEVRLWRLTSSFRLVIFTFLLCFSFYISVLSSCFELFTRVWVHLFSHAPCNFASDFTSCRWALALWIFERWALNFTSYCCLPFLRTFPFRKPYASCESLPTLYFYTHMAFAFNLKPGIFIGSFFWGTASEHWHSCTDISARRMSAIRFYTSQRSCPPIILLRFPESQSMFVSSSTQDSFYPLAQSSKFRAAFRWNISHSGFGIFILAPWFRFAFSPTIIFMKHSKICFTWNVLFKVSCLQASNSHISASRAELSSHIGSFSSINRYWYSSRSIAGEDISFLGMFDVSRETRITFWFQARIKVISTGTQNRYDFP